MSAVDAFLGAVSGDASLLLDCAVPLPKGPGKSNAARFPTKKPNGEVPRRGRPSTPGYFFYEVSDSGIVIAKFGCHKDGIHRTQTSAGAEGLSAEEARIVDKLVKEMQRAVDAETKRTQRQVAKREESLWEEASPAPTGHGYLAKKGIEPHDLRVNANGMLMVSVRDIDGRFQGNQYINPHFADKRYAKGMKVAGGMHVLGELAEPLFLAEGIATAATIREVTGANVVCCFDCGNMVKVARDIRARHPSLYPVVAGDDDWQTDGNPGKTHAKEAADILGSVAVFPQFDESVREGDYTDFNDLRIHLDADEVAAQLPLDVPPEGKSRPAIPQSAPAQGSGSTTVTEALAEWQAAPIPHGYKLWTHKKAHRCRLVWVKVDAMGIEHETPVSTPIWVLAGTRTRAGDRFGLVIRWIDRDGGAHPERAFAITDMGGGRPDAPYLHEMLSQGFYLNAGMHTYLYRFLNEQRPDNYVECTPKLGWLPSDDGALAYIVPRDTIARSGQAPVVYQPDGMSPIAAAIRESSTLEDWQREVVGRCQGHPLLVFALSLAFSPGLLLWALDCQGGVHFFGQTSQGKTTMAQVAASVHGYGAAPADAVSDAFVQTWNSTRNNLEILAESANDGLLVLDEIGQAAGRDAAKMVYDAASGLGKGRMRANGTMRDRRSWRAIVLSTGEISLEQLLAEEGQKFRGGMGVRVLGVPVEKGSIIDAPNARNIIEGLKLACAHSYGTAFPQFLRGIVERFSSSFEVDHYVKEQLAASLDRLVDGRDLAAEHRRALKRIALAEVAGKLAISFGVLSPLSTAEIEEASQVVGDLWLGSTAGETDMDRAVRQVREWLETRHGSLPLSTEIGQGTVPGYRCEKTKQYLLLAVGFRQACEGYDPKAVASELHHRGLLGQDSSGKLSVPTRLTALGRRVRCYQISYSIVEAD